MTESTPRDVDVYLERLFVGDDASLRGALDSSHADALPDIHVTPIQGKLLTLLAAISGASRILEVGTLGGYSTICMARALPEGGKLVTLEVSPKHAEVARRNVDRAGVGERVEIVVGAATESLANLEGPFDFVFIDANKDQYPEYLAAIVPLCSSGAVVLADNVVREGAVLAPSDPLAEGAAAFLEAMAKDERLDATVIQVVGAKGHDGIAVARVR